MIMPHATSHVIARERCSLHVDVTTARWVATRYVPDPCIAQRILGTDDRRLTKR
jgi:hypothetical protein